MHCCWDARPESASANFCHLSGELCAAHYDDSADNDDDGSQSATGEHRTYVPAVFWLSGGIRWRWYLPDPSRSTTY